MTERDALANVFERAAGICECIGGGCPALTHRPGVNRCFGVLRNPEATVFFTVARFADRSDPENIVALCGSCAASPRRNAVRIQTTTAPVTSGTETADDGLL